MKKCPNCGSHIADDSRFCNKCGKEIPQGTVCPHCGASVNDGDAFCQNCGTKIEMSTSKEMEDTTQKRCRYCGAPVNDGDIFCKNCYKKIDEAPSNNKKIIVPTLIGLIVLAVIGGGWYYWDYSNKKSAGEKSIVGSRVFVRQESNNSTKEKNTVKISNDGNSKLHNYGLNTHHHLVGTFEDASGVYPVELDFTSNRETVTDVVYKNVTYGGKIRMTCSFFDQRRLTVEGKDGRNKFVISLECIDKNGFKGTAKDGAKKLLVVMSANCSHK